MSEALTGVRAVSFDAFGTLLTLDASVPRLVELLDERHGLRVSEAQAGAALRAEVAYYRAHMDEGRDAPSVTALRLRCGEVLWRALPGGPRLQAADPQAVADTLLAALRFRLYPDVTDTLARLRAAGLRLVVTSNWDASLPDVLARVGLGGACDAVVSSAAVGAAKPDPQPLLFALAQVNTPPSAAVHVGDSPHEDVAAARAAGVTPILLTRPEGADPHGGAHTAPPPPRQISTLAALPALLGL